MCQVGSKCSVSRAFDFLIACIKGTLIMDIEAVVFRGIQYCFYTYQLLKKCGPDDNSPASSPPTTAPFCNQLTLFRLLAFGIVTRSKLTTEYR